MEIDITSGKSLPEIIDNRPNLFNLERHEFYPNIFLLKK